MMLKYVSLSRAERRDSLSRTKHYNLLLINKRHTYTRTRQWKRRETEGEIRLSNHL
jgi:hypothetical protein